MLLQLNITFYLHAMSYIVQKAVVDRLADIAHRPLGIGWSDDLVRARSILIGSEDANFTSGHFLFVDVHCLEEEKKQQQKKTLGLNFSSFSDTDFLVLGLVWCTPNYPIMQLSHCSTSATIYTHIYLLL